MFHGYLKGNPRQHTKYSLINFFSIIAKCYKIVILVAIPAIKEVIKISFEKELSNLIIGADLSCSHLE